MKLSDLGERKIIELFAKNFDECRGVIVGIGDDACVLEFNEGNYLVVSTDFISQKAHIPKEMSPKQLGRYVVNVCLSDITAMGAKPLGLVFSFGLPGDLDKDFVEELSKGINKACKEHEICTSGGDTKEHSEIVIAGTAFGKVEKDKFLTRDKARVGDLICVTGFVGLAAAGFYCLIKNMKIEKQISNRLTNAALEPRARVKEGVLLGSYANACMDISDGLAFSLCEIAKASKTGFLVYEDKIPVDEDVKKVSEALGISTREMVFHKGGDYELLFTISPERYDEMHEKMKKIGTDVIVIGEITREGREILNLNGEREDLEPRGYESFITRF
jgi:thiamine-monophosphate kinase